MSNRPEMVPQQSFFRDVFGLVNDPLSRESLSSALQDHQLEVRFQSRRGKTVSWRTRPPLGIDAFEYPVFRGIALSARIIASTDRFTNPEKLFLDAGTREHPLETGASPYSPATETLRVGTALLALMKLTPDIQEHLELQMEHFLEHYPLRDSIKQRDYMALFRRFRTTDMLHYKINDVVFCINDVQENITDEKGLGISIIRR